MATVRCNMAPNSPMTSDDRELLLDKITDLMALQTMRNDSIPYVAADGTFGVKADKGESGMYAMYHFIDSLSRHKLFDSPQRSRSDMDTAMYELRRDNPFQVFDEVKLFINADDQFQVTVRSEKTVDDIVAAIDRGIKDARKAVRERAALKQAWEDQKRADIERNKMPPVFSPETDSAFAAAYLAMRVAEEVPSSNITTRYEGADPEIARFTNDFRPRLRAEYDLDPSANFGPVNKFNNETLPEVFNGQMAIHFNMTARLGDRMDVEVSGTPARLTADILDNDIAGARRAAEKLQGQLGDDELKKVFAEINRRDTTKQLTDQVQAGTKAPVSAPRAAKFTK